MEIITTPWKSRLLDLVSESKHSIKITSPFVKQDICKDIISVKNKNVEFELITSFKIGNIHSGALDIDGLEFIIDHKGTVKNFSKLHSKIYLFDNKKAVVTSSNLTSGGLVNNHEYGIFLNDDSLVPKIVFDFNQISKNENTGTIKKTDIKTVREIISKIPKIETIKFPESKIENFQDSNISIPRIAIINALDGWKLDVFNVLNIFKEYEFDLIDVYKFEVDLQKLHPKNKNIKDKIRQQLQNLRDIGLIEFKGFGEYRKLW